jgi:hypothetical protein
MDFVFVRHGESTWNTTFNRSKLPWKFIPRLLDAAFKEIMLIITGQQDSWFIDSPLSDLGLEQVSPPPPPPSPPSCPASVVFGRLEQFVLLVEV